MALSREQMLAITAHNPLDIIVIVYGVGHKIVMIKDARMKFPLKTGYRL